MALGGLNGIRDVHPFLIMSKSLVIVVLIFTDCNYYYCRRDGSLPGCGIALRLRGLLSSFQAAHSGSLSICVLIKTIGGGATTSEEKSSFSQVPTKAQRGTGHCRFPA